MQSDVNYIAVVVAAVANMALGALWFGPLFGKQWVKASGITSERMEEAKKKGMASNYFLMFIGSLLTAYILSHIVIFADAYPYLEISDMWLGLSAGFVSWMGFVAPVTIGVVLWEGKSWRHWLITYGFHLAGLLLMGVMLALWM